MAVANPATLPRARRRSLLIPAVVMALCLLLVAAGLGYVFFLRPGAASRPAVWFDRPSSGERVQVGEALALHPIAQSPGGVVRVELWVDGRLQEAERSSVEGGISPFHLPVTWRPPTPGPHTLTARAFDTRGHRAHASITVEAVAEPDQDGDGAPDATDACSDQPGAFTAGGCPDRDGDGIADAEDGCPEQAGLEAGDGCPAPTAEDGDGDGVPDAEDAAPGEPGPPSGNGRPDGDGDGVPDAEDRCPGEPAESDDGCRGSADRDGDGTPDAADDCPDEPGTHSAHGCPDRDGDGVADGRDLCPDQPGPPGHGGCPPSGAGDRDGDGVGDDDDLAPSEPGRPEDGGCPPPGEGSDEDHDGVPDDTEPPTVPLSPGRFLQPGFERPPVTVEFEGLEFSVGHDYSRVHCYASLTGGVGEERVEFESLGERKWDIAAELGGENARRVSVPAGEPLEVKLRCGASVEFTGPDGGWGTYYDLGYFAMRHPSSDWDGHVITVSSTPGPDGHSFQAKYRLCSGSCEPAALPAPVTLMPVRIAGTGMVLAWRWDGDERLLEGFKVYMDGSHILTADPDTTLVSIEDYEPPCGSARRAFYVTAYGVPGESPPSNTQYRWSRPCPRIVRVTFVSLDTGDLGDDERYWRDWSVGPVYGDLYVAASSVETLSFGCVYRPRSDAFRPKGVRLEFNTHYDIQELFITMERVGIAQEWPYTAPPNGCIVVELGARGNLSMGGRIWDADTGNPDDLMFQGRLTLQPDEVNPGTYTIRDREIELEVRVEVLEGS